MEKFGICVTFLFFLLSLSSDAFSRVDEEALKDDQNHVEKSFRNYWSEIMSDIDDDEWQMVKTKGNQFVVNDQPFYINGFNTYWLMMFAADNSTRGKVTDVFKQASSRGMTVCRTWAFNDGQWRALQKSPSVYDEEVFKVPVT